MQKRKDCDFSYAGLKNAFASQWRLQPKSAQREEAGGGDKGVEEETWSEGGRSTTVNVEMRRRRDYPTRRKRTSPPLSSASPSGTSRIGSSERSIGMTASLLQCLQTTVERWSNRSRNWASALAVVGVSLPTEPCVLRYMSCVPLQPSFSL